MADAQAQAAMAQKENASALDKQRRKGAYKAPLGEAVASVAWRDHLPILKIKSQAPYSQALVARPGQEARARISAIRSDLPSKPMPGSAGSVT